MPNLAGKSYAFNAFTPIGRWRVWIVRGAFLLIRIASFKFVQRLLYRVSLVADQQRLIDLSFIHFARWSIVRRRNWANFGDGQPGDSPAYAYLLFASNFNGQWEQYIDAFSSVVPGGMNLIWKPCVGYPGAKPITRFLEYIRLNQFDTDYYYSAYPNAATADIRGALDLVEQLDAFAKRTESIAPTRFKDEFERFLIAVSHDLSTTGPAPWADDPDEPIMPRTPRADDRADVAGVTVEEPSLVTAGTPA